MINLIVFIRDSLTSKKNLEIELLFIININKRIFINVFHNLICLFVCVSWHKSKLRLFLEDWPHGLSTTLFFCCHDWFITNDFQISIKNSTWFWLRKVRVEHLSHVPLILFWFWPWKYPMINQLLKRNLTSH